MVSLPAPALSVEAALKITRSFALLLPMELRRIAGIDLDHVIRSVTRERYIAGDDGDSDNARGGNAVFERFDGGVQREVHGAQPTPNSL